MAGLVRPLFAEPAKHLLGLVRDPAYRDYHRLAGQLRRLPRYTPGTANVLGRPFAFPDAASFVRSYEEIFRHRIYDFTFEGHQPFILDLGANVGLSVRYFKHRYPQARILAFEADPVVFGYLQANVLEADLGDVELRNEAIWIAHGALPFRGDGADAGLLAAEADETTVTVPTAAIDQVLAAQAVDFLKMDIEGAEGSVFPACVPFLPNIQCVFVEFHSRPGAPQSLSAVIGPLEETGFRVAVHDVWGSRSPLAAPRVNREGFDYQANIFAWRAPRRDWESAD